MLFSLSLLRRVVVMSDRYVGHVLSDVRVPGTGQIWLDDVMCTDSCLISNLNQCSHRGWGVHDCTHDQDVSIACYNRSTELVQRTYDNHNH